MSRIFLSKHLRHRYQSLPLSNLKQGTTLSIQTKLFLPNNNQQQQQQQQQKLRFPPINVTIQPSWRDDGFIELKQYLPSNDDNTIVPIQMIVNQDKNNIKETALGRMESLISVVLQPIIVPPKNETTTTTTSVSESISTTEKLPTERVMFDDGTLLPVDNLDKVSTEATEYHDGIAHVANETLELSSHNKTPTIEHKQTNEDERNGIYLTVGVPEKINFICDLRNEYSNIEESNKENDVKVDLESGIGLQGSVTVTGKIEGNVQIYTTDGDIRVTKLRGHRIELHTKKQTTDNSTTTSGPIIYASNLLEAQNLIVSNTNGRFRAKQIHGRVIDINIGVNETMNQSDDVEENDDEGSIVDISSLFVSGNGGANINVTYTTPTPSLSLNDTTSTDNWLTRRAVRIKSHHGPVQVQTNGLPIPNGINETINQQYPLVELGGINGNCEVNIEKTTTVSSSSSSSQEEEDNDWSSCILHVDSLSPQSVSLATVDKGNIALTIDRKVESDLRLLSTKDPSCIVETSALLAEEENSSLIVDVLRHLPSNQTSSTATNNESDNTVNPISISTRAFTKRIEESFQGGDLQYVEGWVENKSDEPDSRFERKLRGDSHSVGAVGKVRLDGAANQALNSFIGGDREGEDEKQNEES